MTTSCPCPARGQRICRQGFALFAILVAIILLGAFLIVSARLFGSVIRTTVQADAAEAAIASFESATRTLQADTWGASALAVVADGSRTTLERGSGGPVTWAVDEAGALVRTEARDDGTEDVRRWPDLGPRVTFSAGSAWLAVTVTDANGIASNELRLVSQVLLAREMSR